MKLRSALMIGGAFILASVCWNTDAKAAISVYTTDFIGTPEYFNGFDGIENSPNFYDNTFYPENVPYSEGGITVKYITGPSGGSEIWTTSTQNYGGQGYYSWYPNGGSYGYTDITLTGGGQFSAIQFLAGNGQAKAEPLAYQLLDDGSVIASGTLQNAAYPLHYIGFSGEDFDEVRLQSSQWTPSFDPNNFDALALDSIAADSSGPPPPPPPPIPAVATLSSKTVNFGTVRAGTANVTGSTTVTNTGTGYPVDNLNVTSATGLPSNVSVSGALPTGLESAQSGDIGFLLDTATPGVVGGSATLDFTSTSAAESLDLASQQVSFTGTVTQLANAVLLQDSGAGSFSGSGTAFTLDLGSVQAGTGSLVADLGVLNDVLSTTYGETLGGSFVISKGKGYSLLAAPFSGLVGGATDIGNLLSFDPSGLHNGTYDVIITLDGISSYAGLSNQDLAPITLTVTANIFGAGVPEPSTWAMMLIGLGGLGGMIRSQRRCASSAAYGP
jgi:hypothetical protein